MSDPLSQSRKQELSVAAAVAIAMLLLVALVQDLAAGIQRPQAESARLEPISVFPDFAGIERIDVKKQQFFDYLEVFVIEENRNISAVREQLLIRAEIVNNDIALSGREREWMLGLATAYKVEGRNSDKEIVEELLSRIDVVPVSLALAQAANESAWGTSRFALEGNNLFGEWCFVEGCGIVPRRRPSSASHEVRSFDSVAQSVQSYLNNINSHQLYSYLRDLRGYMRRQEQSLDPMVLAFGLGRYSERGEHYVDEVQNIIIQNNLQSRDGQASSIAGIDPLH